MAQFKITITDLEENKVMVDTETDSVWCNYKDGEASRFVAGVNASSTDIIALAVGTLDGLRNYLEHLFNDKGISYKTAILLSEMHSKQGDTDNEG